MGTCSKWLKVIKFEPKKERPQWLNEGKQKWKKQIRHHFLKIQNVHIFHVIKQIKEKILTVFFVIVLCILNLTVAEIIH